MGLPLYKQIRNTMQNEIQSMKAHDTILSERDLAQMYDASRMTVRKAVDELVEEGYLYRDAKRGTFVADRTNIKKNSLIESMGRSDLKHNVLYFNVRPTLNQQVQEALDVDSRTHLIKMTRLISDEQGPIAIEEVYMERKKMLDEEVGKMTKWKSYSRFLGDGNVITQRFLADVVPVEYAKLLKMKLDDPIMIVENYISTKMGERLLFIRLFHNPRRGTIEITT